MASSCGQASFQRRLRTAFKIHIIQMYPEEKKGFKTWFGRHHFERTSKESIYEEPLACFHANCHHLFHTHDKLVRFLISNPGYGDNDMLATFFMSNKLSCRWSTCRLTVMERTRSTSSSTSFVYDIFTKVKMSLEYVHRANNGWNISITLVFFLLLCLPLFVASLTWFQIHL